MFQKEAHTIPIVPTFSRPTTTSSALRYREAQQESLDGVSARQPMDFLGDHMDSKAEVDDPNPDLSVFDALQPTSRSSSVFPLPSDTNEPHDDSDIEELGTATGNAEDDFDLLKSDTVGQDGRKLRPELKIVVSLDTLSKIEILFS
ncbi:hypothetical protein B0H13DRAFT_2311706 [Mycena leptocephala]|nr:hypothetical protein B0H13DRAFT_2311706 [Mycena leptocephala]